MTGRTLVALAVAAFAGGVASAGGMRVVAASGMRAADGRGLTSFSEPVLAAPGRLLFKAESDAIVVDDGSERRVLVATGDALPDGPGTYDRLSRPLIVGERRFAFTADVNRAGGARLLGRWADDAVEVLATGVGGMRGGDVNARGDFVYQSGSRSVDLWLDGPRTLVALVRRDQLGGRIRSRPVLNEQASVAIISDRFGSRAAQVFRSRAGDGLVQLAADGSVSPRGEIRLSGVAALRSFGGDPDVAIDERDDVAFVAYLPGQPDTDLLLVDRPASGLEVLAAEGDVVAGRAIETIWGNGLEFDAAGDLYFWAQLAGVPAERRLVVSPGAAALAPPPVPRDAAAAPWLPVRRTDQAVYERSTSGVRRVVGEGDLLADGSVVESLGRVVASGDLTAIGTGLIGPDGYGRSILRDTRSGPVRYVSDGDLGPREQPIGLASGVEYAWDEQAMSVHDDRLVFLGWLGDEGAAIFQKRPGSPPRILVALSDPFPKGLRLGWFSAAALGGGGLLFTAGLDPEGSAAFRVSDGRIALLTRSGRRAPGTGGRRIARIASPTVAGARVGVRARLEEGFADVLLVSDAGGPLARVDRGEVAVEPDNRAFVLTPTRTIEARSYPADDGHFLVVWDDDGRARPVLTANESTPLGGVVTGFGYYEPLVAATDRRAVASVTLSDEAAARSALLSVSLPD